MFLKYCENVIGAQNMLMYFRLHFLYIWQGVDASQANLLKKPLRILRVVAFDTELS